MNKQRFNRVASDPSQLQMFVNEVAEAGSTKLYIHTLRPADDSWSGLIKLINNSENLYTKIGDIVIPIGSIRDGCILKSTITGNATPLIILYAQNSLLYIFQVLESIE